MSFRSYTPKRGDLVHMNFSPSSGHEMAGRHYGLVLSPISYCRRMGMALVCPITSRVRRYPFEVFVPSGLLPPKKGAGEVTSVVIADAIRQVDFREREMEFIAEAPAELVEEVLDLLLAAVENE